MRFFDVGKAHSEGTQALNIIRTSGSATAPRTATAETMRERKRIVKVLGGSDVGRLRGDVLR